MAVAAASAWADGGCRSVAGGVPARSAPRARIVVVGQGGGGGQRLGQQVAGQVWCQPGQRPGAGGVAGDGGGQRLGQQVRWAGVVPARSAPRRGRSRRRWRWRRPAPGPGQRAARLRQVGCQRGQRLGAGVVVGDGGGGGQRLGQDSGLLGGQVRRQPGQRLGAGVVAGDGGGGGQRLGQQVRWAGGVPARPAPGRGRSRR